MGAGYLICRRDDDEPSEYANRWWNEEQQEWVPMKRATRFTSAERRERGLSVPGEWVPFPTDA